VECVTVHLDNHALRSPEEIHLVAADSDVGRKRPTTPWSGSEARTSGGAVGSGFGSGLRP
jgi:hypothetical protein